MNFSLFQILIGIVAVYFIIDRIRKFLNREYRQSLLKAAVLVTIWLIVLISTIFPGYTQQLMKNLGLGDATSFISIAFLILYILIFKLINIIERMEKEITEIVRKEALRDIIDK